MVEDSDWTTRFTMVPPARLRSACCGAGDDAPPPKDQVFFLELSKFLMSCPGCGAITPWVAEEDG